MTPTEVADADEDAKSQLRAVRARDAPQLHWDQFQWHAAPGADVQVDPNLAASARTRAAIYEQLPALADPVPDPPDWVSGIPHYSSNASASGEPWPVLRSMHSRKMHYLVKLTKAITEDYNVNQIPLLRCFPDTNPDRGFARPLSVFNLNNLRTAYNLKTPMDLVKHIFTLHDGEVRTCGEERWAAFPASGGPPVQACFWSYQFMKKDRRIQ